MAKKKISENDFKKKKDEWFDKSFDNICVCEHYKAILKSVDKLDDDICGKDIVKKEITELYEKHLKENGNNTLSMFSSLYDYIRGEEQ